MINRFKFHSESEGRTYRCVAISVGRSHVTVVASGGKIFSVPMHLLKHDSESPITDEAAEALIEKGVKHVKAKRERDAFMRAERARIDADLFRALGFRF